MQFNSEATNQDIVSDITFFLTGRYDGSIDYHINDITRNVNRRFDELAAFILQSDGRWQWDDNNQTTLPLFTDDLVAGQQDYEVSAASFLNVIEVAVKKADGKWQVLIPLDRNRGKAQSLTELEDGSTGLPTHYDKIGNSIMVYPKPSASYVTLSEGIQIIAQRPPSYFVIGDTTKAPGFAPIFHRVLSIGASIDFCIANGMSKKQVALEREYEKQLTNLMAYFASRSKDEQHRLALQTEDYGGEDFGGAVSENRFNL